MSDEPITYGKLNPRMILGTPSTQISKPIKFSFFNEDGTAPDVSITEAQLMEMAKTMMAALPEDTEAKHVLTVLELLNNLIERGTLSLMDAMNNLIHSDQVAHLDHDTMCPTLDAYFSTSSITDVDETEHPDELTLLDKFIQTGTTRH